MGISNLAGNSSTSSSGGTSSTVTLNFSQHPVHPCLDNSPAAITSNNTILDMAAYSNAANRYVLSSSNTPNPHSSDASYGIKGSVELDSPKCILFADDVYVSTLNVNESSNAVYLDQKPYINGTGYTNGVAVHQNASTRTELFKLSASTALLVAYKPANIANTSPSATVAYVISVNGSGTITVSTPVVIHSSWQTSTARLVGTSTFVTLFKIPSANYTDYRAVAFSVSGTTVTLGTAVTVFSHSFSDYSTRIAELSATRLVWLWGGWDSSTHYYTVLTVTGTTISVGSQSTLSLTSGTVSSSLFSPPVMYNCGTDKVVVFGSRNASNASPYGFFVGILSFASGATSPTNVASTYGTSTEVGRWLFAPYDATKYVLMSYRKPYSGSTYDVSVHSFVLDPIANSIYYDAETFLLNTEVSGGNARLPFFAFDFTNKIIVAYTNASGSNGSMCATYYPPATGNYTGSIIKRASSIVNSNFNGNWYSTSPGTFALLFHSNSANGVWLSSGEAQVFQALLALKESVSLRNGYEVYAGMHQTGGQVVAKGLAATSSSLTLVPGTKYSFGSGSLTADAAGKVVALESNKVYITSEPFA